jgi:hypothetical protein
LTAHRVFESLRTIRSPSIDSTGEAKDQAVLNRYVSGAGHRDADIPGRVTEKRKVMSPEIIDSSIGGIFTNGGQYAVENTLNHCAFGLQMGTGDKYRFNTTFNCSTPFTGGIALTSENN